MCSNMVTSIVHMTWAGLCDHSKRGKIIFKLTSYNFCIYTSIVKLELTIFEIHNC